MPLRYAAVVVGSALLACHVFLGRLYEVARWTPTSQVQALLTVTTLAAGLACLLAAGLRVRAPQRLRSRWYARCRHVVLGMALALSIETAGLVVLALAVVTLPAARSYVTDSITFTFVNAQLVVAGRNPYTSDAVFAETLRRYPSTLATPLRRGSFGNGYDAPRPDAHAAAMRRYLADSSASQGEFDPRTLHSYPALSFLVYAPLVWAGLPNILILNLAVYLALLAALIGLAPPGQRRWAALAASSAVTVVADSLVIDTEAVSIGLVLLAWHWRRRPWLGPVLIGAACAFRQYCWFFAIFLLLDALRAGGWREAVRFAAISLGAFLLPNLPFLVASPGPWFQSLWLPMSEPLFPEGVGVVVLSVGHLLPYGPPLCYALIEGTALAVALVAAWRWHARLGDAALLLALVPLYFAFRSLPNYFAFAPWLSLYAAIGAFALRPGARPVGTAARIPVSAWLSRTLFARFNAAGCPCYTGMYELT